MNPGSAEWGDLDTYQNQLGRKALWNVAASFPKVLVFCWLQLFRNNRKFFACPRERRAGNIRIKI
ncbi:MAG: hypothetical protein PHD57_10875, partial [Desulfobacterales bacterium]|nr:hypothetical protein [Desulfobacterales bacterium]